MTPFVLLAVLLTLVAVAIPVFPLVRNNDEAASPLPAVALALAIPAGVVLMYLAVSNQLPPRKTLRVSVGIAKVRSSSACKSATARSTSKTSRAFSRAAKPTC